MKAFSSSVDRNYRQIIQKSRNFLIATEFWHAFVMIFTNFILIFFALFLSSVKKKNKFKKRKYVYVCTQVSVSLYVTNQKK